MSVPIQLSQSPVHEAFHGIVGDPLQKLQLSTPEVALLQAAEANPLEYTLIDQHDAEAYAHVLLKVIDQCTTSKTKTSKSRHVPAVAKLSLLQLPLQDDEALQLLYVDTMGVVLHYAISKLTAVIQALHAMNSRSSKSSTRRKKKTAVVSVASIFYTTTTTSSRQKIVLTEHCRRPLKRLLTGSMSDAYAQRGAAVCLAWILAAGLELSSSAEKEKASSSSFNNKKDEEEDDPLFGLVSAPLPATTTTTTTTTTEDNDTTTSLLNSMESFVSWMTSRLASAKNSSDLSIVLPALMVFIPSSPTVRQAFDRAGGLAYLSRHLRIAKPTTTTTTTTTTIYSSNSIDDLYLSSSVFDNDGSSSIATMRTAIANSNTRVSVQQLYELTYVVWLLSFDCCDVTKDRLRKHFYRDGVVSHLVDLVIAKPREKVVRVALATLKNLAQCHEQQPDLPTLQIHYSSSNGNSLAAANEKVDAKRSKLSRGSSSGSLTKSSPKRNQQLSGTTAADSSGLNSPLDALKLSPTSSSRRRRTTMADNGTTVFSSSPSLLYKSSSSTSITGHDFCKEMVACGLLKPMDRMLAAAAANNNNNNSKMTDPDMLQDLQVLREILDFTFRHMTSWDVYVSEIESTHLQWGIVHTEQFFRENVKRMEGKDGKFGIVRVCVFFGCSLVSFSVAGAEQLILSRHDPRTRSFPFLLFFCIQICMHIIFTDTDAARHE